MKRRILYVWGGAPYHATEEHNAMLANILASDGRYELEATIDLDAFASLPDGKFAAVVVYTTGYHDELTPARERGLLDFVRNGGGFVGIHSASHSFTGNANYIEMLGSAFVTHPAHHEFTVNIVNPDHYLTVRMPDFSIYDEMYHLDRFDPSQVTLLTQTPWQGKPMPMAYVKEYGQGKVAYLALGHTLQAWKHPEFQKLLIRAIAWSSGAQASAKTIHCAALGYGGAFNMGKGHLGWIDATPGMQAVAVCDADPKRVETARQELPHHCRPFADG